MSKRFKHIILSFVLATWFLSGCDNTPVIEVQSKTDPYKENMINANKNIAGAEDTQIKSYIDRRGWKMTQLSNGEWIEVTKPGKGPKISYEDSVSVSYRLEALNGAVFYENQEETFVVGRHQTTVGLDRAVMEFQHGTEARVVLPSSLAYGIVGDGDRVPGRAVLIYYLKVK